MNFFGREVFQPSSGGEVPPVLSKSQPFLYISPNIKWATCPTTRELAKYSSSVEVSSSSSFTWKLKFWRFFTSILKLRFNCHNRHQQHQQQQHQDWLPNTWPRLGAEKPIPYPLVRNWMHTAVTTIAWSILFVTKISKIFCQNIDIHKYSLFMAKEWNIELGAFKKSKINMDRTKTM